MNNKYCVDPNDRWFINEICLLLIGRIAGLANYPEEVRLSEKLLGALLQLPNQISHLCMQVSWVPVWVEEFKLEAAEVSRSITISEDSVTIQSGQTRLTYFKESHDFFNLYDLLEGAEKQRFLNNWLPDFEELSNASQLVHFVENGASINFSAGWRMQGVFDL